MNKARKIIKLIAIVIMLAAIAVFLTTSYSIIEERREDELSQSEYDLLREIANVEQSPTDRQGGGAVITAPSVGREGIDFDALFAVNPDVVGWIYLPGTVIDYPIVQEADNVHYLYHTIRGNRNVSGAIFLDWRDSPDFMGQSRIYGHNMRNGTMFGSLAAWTGDTIIIYTPETRMEYSVTMRGILPVAEVAELTGELILITCIRGRPEVRYVVQGERTVAPYEED